MTLILDKGNPIQGTSSTNAILPFWTSAPKVTCKPPLPRVRHIRNRKVSPCTKNYISQNTSENEGSRWAHVGDPDDGSKGKTCLSSYSSSSLDEPIPQWTAYSPKKGVAWAPCRTHRWSEPNDHSVKIRSLNNLSSSLTSLIDSIASILGTPQLSRKKSKAKNSTTIVKPIAHSSSVGNLCTNFSSVTKITINRSYVDITPTPIEDMAMESCDSPDSGFSRITNKSEIKITDTVYEHLLENVLLIKPEKENSGCGSTASPSLTRIAIPSCYSRPIRSQYIPDLDIGKQHDQIRVDYPNLIIKRMCLKTGTLLYRENHITCCRGSFRSKRNQYPSYTRPVTIHIYTGVNTEDGRSRLLQSIQSIRQLNHLYIHTVWGACLEGSPNTPEGVEILVATGCTHFHVNLYRLLRWTRENNSQLLTGRCMTSIGKQLCRGMQYLQDQCITHSNLKAKTIMLDPTCTAKISVLAENERTTDPRHRWMSIETLHTNVTTRNSAIWSIGVVLWELITLGSHPYHHLQHICDVCVYLSKGKRLIRPDTCSKHFYRIMTECWRTKARDRPTYRQLEAMLTVYSQTLPVSKPMHELYPNTYDYWEEDLFTNDDQYSEDEYI